MEARDAIAEELARFLSEVPSAAREKLHRRIESACLNGEVRPEYTLILNALKALPDETETEIDPEKTPRDLFFESVEPFVTKWPDSEKKQRGRIPETALAPIWEWLRRDLAPKEIGPHEERALRALRKGNLDAALSEMDTAREKVDVALSALFKEASSDKDVWRRTSNHIGGTTMLDHVSEIREVFQARLTLNKMAQRLPALLNENDPDQVATALEAVAIATGDGRVSPDLLLAFLAARFSDPARALRVAIEALGGDSAETLAQGPYVILGDLVLYELENIVGNVSKNINRAAIDETVRSNIEAFAVMSRRFAANIDLSKPNPWSGRLTAARARISDLLGPQLDLLSRSLRKALAPASDLPLKAMPDASECEDALGRIDLLVMLSGHAEELALKDRITQVRGRTEAYVEAANAAVTNAIRHSTGDAQTYANAYLDFAVKVSERLHGEEFARVLRRLGHAARPKPGEEMEAEERPRKSA